MAGFGSHHCHGIGNSVDSQEDDQGCQGEEERQGMVLGSLYTKYSFHPMTRVLNTVQ